jgi:hypothetical protein
MVFRLLLQPLKILQTGRAHAHSRSIKNVPLYGNQPPVQLIRSAAGTEPLPHLHHSREEETKRGDKMAQNLSSPAGVFFAHQVRSFCIEVN